MTKIEEIRVRARKWHQEVHRGHLPRDVRQILDDYNELLAEHMTVVGHKKELAVKVLGPSAGEVVSLSELSAAKKEADTRLAGMTSKLEDFSSSPVGVWAHDSAGACFRVALRLMTISAGFMGTTVLASVTPAFEAAAPALEVLAGTSITGAAIAAIPAVCISVVEGGSKLGGTIVEGQVRRAEENQILATEALELEAGRLGSAEALSRDVRHRSRFHLLNRTISSRIKRRKSLVSIVLSTPM